MSDFNPLLTMEACVFHKSAIPSMSKWKDVCLVLMPNSTLGWYKANRKLVDCVRLSTVCKYLCVGHMAKAFSKVPKLPRDADLNQLLGVPVMNAPRPDKMHWFCFDHVKHVIKFLQALDTVLPTQPTPKAAAVAASVAADASGVDDKAVQKAAVGIADVDINHDEADVDTDYAADHGEQPQRVVDDKRQALLAAGGLLATGLLLGPDQTWAWGYGWGGSGGISGGPVFQGIEEGEFLGYCLPSRGLGTGGGPGSYYGGRGINRYNRAYQRFNSDLGNDLDRWEEDQDKRAERRGDWDNKGGVDSGGCGFVAAAAAGAVGDSISAPVSPDFDDYNDHAAAAAIGDAADVADDYGAAASTLHVGGGGGGGCGDGGGGTEVTTLADYSNDDNNDPFDAGACGGGDEDDDACRHLSGLDDGDDVAAAAASAAATAGESDDDAACATAGCLDEDADEAAAAAAAAAASADDEEAAEADAAYGEGYLDRDCDAFEQQQQEELEEEHGDAADDGFGYYDRDYAYDEDDAGRCDEADDYFGGEDDADRFGGGGGGFDDFGRDDEY